MKKQFILLFTLLLLCTSAWAQKEFRLAKATGRLNLNLSGAVVEGYDGNDIIFSIQKGEDDAVDERAKGLQAISGSGYIDNTGLGIDVTPNGQDINVNVVGRRLKGILNIKVPQNIKISFSYNSSMYHDEVFLKNLKNEIEVSTTYNKIKLENNTGPMNIKTVYGSIDATFTGAIKGPVSIISVYNYVDVTLPVTTKANVELATSYGKLYAADEFKIAIKKDFSGNQSFNEVRPAATTTISGSEATVNNVRITARRTDGDNSSAGARNGRAEVFATVYGGEYRTGENIKGTINGGGVDLIFKSNYKNVYLRQK